MNFNVPGSIGTAQELAIANENKIPVLGLNTKGLTLHPWLIESCERMFNEMDDLVDYVRAFYLN